MKGSDFPEPDTKVAEAEQAIDEAPAVQPGEAQAAPVKEDKSTEIAGAEIQAENPDKIVTGAQEEVSLKPADPKDEATVAGGEALPPPAEVLSHPTTSETAPQTPKIAEGKLEPKETPRTNGRTSTRKPAAISTAKSPARSARGTSAARSPLPKSPLPKTPTVTRSTPAATASKSPAPAKAQPKAAVSKETTKPVAPKTTRAPVKPSTATAGTTASAAAKAKPTVAETKKTTTKPAASAPPPKASTTTSPGGFVKPKPRSPTRPVRLPSHLTAPTAASAAKHGEEAAAQKPARKPSTASRPAPKAPAPAAKTQSSRTSLAPSTAAPKRPASRASTAAGASDGFLARMMRPTASSSSKTHDKPASPPRRGAAATKVPTKPKAPEGLATKAKKKVEDVATKAKEVVTNGKEEKHEEKHEEENEEKPEGKHEVAGTTATEPNAEKDVETPSAPVENTDSVAGAEEPLDSTPAAEQTESTKPTAVETETPKAQEEAVF